MNETYIKTSIESTKVMLDLKIHGEFYNKEISGLFNRLVHYRFNEKNRIYVIFNTSNNMPESDAKLFYKDKDNYFINIPINTACKMEYSFRSKDIAREVFDIINTRLADIYTKELIQDTYRKEIIYSYKIINVLNSRLISVRVKNNDLYNMFNTFFKKDIFYQADSLNILRIKSDRVAYIKETGDSSYIENKDSCCLSIIHNSGGITHGNIS